MKSSLIILGASALFATASPIDKRAIETVWDYEVVTVIVTAGQEPSGAVFFENPKPTEHTKQQPAKPAPVPVVTTVVEAPKPEPTTATPEPTVAEPVVEEPKSTAAAVISGDIPLTDFKQAVLDHHNIHRANHSAPALVWDETLAGYAENTANGCVFAHDMNQGGGGYGQNLATWGTTGAMADLRIKSAAMGITNQWYNDEMVNWGSYGAENPPSSQPLGDFGHFTQVVWKSSTKVGCATVQCPAGSVLSFPAWYTVCNYNPPGNFGGRYGENVLPPTGAATVSV